MKESEETESGKEEDTQKGERTETSLLYQKKQSKREKKVIQREMELASNV